MIYVYRMDKDDANIITYVTCFDDYYSLIWNDRYAQCGDFQIVVNKEIYSRVLLGDFILWDNSIHSMIIESTDSNFSDGIYTFNISGRSIESILDKRIDILRSSYSNMNPGDIIYNMIVRNFQNTGVFNCFNKVDNFAFNKSYSDNKKITDINMDYENEGVNIYSAVKSICDFYDIGFNIRLLIDENTGIFLMELYTGSDRSVRSSEKVGKVIFSDEIGNIKNAKVTLENVNYKNMLSSIMKIEKPNSFDGGAEYRTKISTKEVAEGDTPVEEPYEEASSYSWNKEENKLLVEGNTFNNVVYKIEKNITREKKYILNADVNANETKIVIVFINSEGFIKNEYFPKDNHFKIEFKVPEDSNDVLIGFSGFNSTSLAEYSNINLNEGSKEYPYVPYNQDYIKVKYIYRGEEVVRDDLTDPKSEKPPYTGILVNEDTIDIPFKKEDDFNWDREFITKARDYFRDKKETKNMEFEIDNDSRNYIFGKDYFIGDIVSVIVDDFEVRARIVEISYSESNGVLKTYPKFEII